MVLPPLALAWYGHHNVNVGYLRFEESAIDDTRFRAQLVTAVLRAFHSYAAVQNSTRSITKK